MDANVKSVCALIQLIAIEYTRREAITGDVFIDCHGTATKIHPNIISSWLHAVIYCHEIILRKCGIHIGLVTCKPWANGGNSPTQKKKNSCLLSLWFNIVNSVKTNYYWHLHFRARKINMDSEIIHLNFLAPLYRWKEKNRARGMWRMIALQRVYPHFSFSCIK